MSIYIPVTDQSKPRQDGPPASKIFSIDPRGSSRPHSRRRPELQPKNIVKNASMFSEQKEETLILFHPRGEIHIVGKRSDMFNRAPATYSHQLLD